MRAGLTYTRLVPLDSGFPDGAVTWSVFKADGTTASTGTITPPANAVSVVITVPASSNTLSTSSLWSPRTLVWSYLVGGVQVSGQASYTLDAPIPFGASCDGVRQLLGLSPSTLPDDQIDLVAGYGEFQQAVTPAKLAPFLNDESYNSIVIRKAIEGQAAYNLIASLQFRVARSEESGTDKIELSKPDFEQMYSVAQIAIFDGYALVNTAADPSIRFGNIFGFGQRTLDPITNN